MSKSGRPSAQTQLAPHEPLIVAICIPSGDSWQADMALSLYGLVTYGAVWNGRRVGVTLHNTRSSILPYSRNRLAATALSTKADYLLWIDSDMKFPATSLERLLAWDKDIVSIAASTRTMPPRLTAAHKKERGYAAISIKPGSAGLVSVDGIGFGMVLAKRAVFEQLQQPWFEGFHIGADGIAYGEDYTFCQKARRAGYDIFVDQGLSHDVEHVGTCGFGLHGVGLKVCSDDAITQ
ncbi:MAG TPA: hypothetical protein VFL54_06770 [Gammaproteobacteria bacterium]|nr:hypothetical protein [Gammaproteobacteria bacterium]